MKKMCAVLAVLGLFLIDAALADARGRSGGRGHGFRGGAGHHAFHGPRFHGHRFHGPRFRGPRLRSSVVIGTSIVFGPSLWPSWYPSYPPVYTAPVVVAPQTYIEPAPASVYWYYCEDAKAYYPYVKECPSGWVPILTQPAPEAQP
jgi:hypothetical protein